MKKQKGITIIALVITVILLIIVTAITINAIVGDDGLINVAEETKEQTSQTRDETQSKLNEIYDTTRTQGNVDSRIAEYANKLNRFKSSISGALTAAGVETSAEETPEQMAEKILGLASSGTEGEGMTNAELAASIGLTADKIVSGNTILGIAGTGGADAISISEAELGYYEDLNQSTSAANVTDTFTVPSGWKKYRIEITTRSGYNATVNMTSSQYGNKTLTRTSNTQVSGNSDGGASDHKIVINSDKSGTITVKGNQRLWYLSMRVCMVK